MSGQKISQIQIICIGVCNLMGTIIISAYVSSVLRHEAWIAGILGFIANLPTLFIYCALTKKYPGKGLFQINEAVFGTVTGRLISGVYLLFFFSVCALNILEATNFLTFFILPNTSRLAIAALLAAGCVYCVKKGILPLARASAFFLIITCAVMLLYGAMTLVNAKFEYLLPLFSHRPLDYIQSTHIAASIPFGESIFLLMLIPDADKKVSVKKTYFAVSAAAALIMVFVHVRETVALGPMAAFSTLPTYEAARLVNIPGVLTRIESVFALVLIMLNLFKAIVLFYICVSGIKRVTRTDSQSYIVMLGFLLVICAITTYVSPVSNVFFGKNVSPFIWSFFTLALPFLTLVAAVIRTAATRHFGRTHKNRVAQ